MGLANQIRMGLQDLTDKDQQFKHAYEVSQRGCRISRIRNIRSTCLRGIRVRLQALTGKEQQFQHAYVVSGRGCRISRIRNNRSHGFGTPDRTRLRGGEHQIEHAYNVSGRGCRISRVGNYRSYMPTRHQEGTSGSHGFETPDRTCLLGVRTVLHDLTGSEHKIERAY